MIGPADSRLLFIIADHQYPIGHLPLSAVAGTVHQFQLSAAFGDHRGGAAAIQMHSVIAALLQ